MNLRGRVEKLERQTGAGMVCPICDVPRADEWANYDQAVWDVGETYDLNVDCVRCKRPRAIKFQVLYRKDERAKVSEH